MELKVIFRRLSMTKNTHRFQEVDSSGSPKEREEGAIIGTLYIQKHALEGIEVNDDTLLVATIDVSES